MTDDVPVTLALPIAERAAALAFYRDALGLEPFGELGSDGIRSRCSSPSTRA